MIWIYIYIPFAILIGYINAKNYVKRFNYHNADPKMVFKISFIVSAFFAPVVILDMILNTIKKLFRKEGKAWKFGI